jgi:hypothetical protein
MIGISLKQSVTAKLIVHCEHFASLSIKSAKESQSLKSARLPHPPKAGSQ